MKTFKTVFYIISIVGVVMYLIWQRDNLYHLCRLSPIMLAALGSVGLFAILTNALFFKKNIEIFDIKLQFKEWFGLTVTNTMYNYLLPFSGGMALRAVYLNRKKNLSYTSYATATAAGFIIAIISASFLCLLYISLRSIQGHKL